MVSSNPCVTIAPTLGPFFSSRVSGERAGHNRAFVNLIRHMPLWRQAHEVYGRIKVPVLLVYGDLDWSREAERQRTQSEVPGARREMVPNGGHCLSLDQPEAVVRLVTEFAQDQGILPATD